MAPLLVLSLLALPALAADLRLEVGGVDTARSLLAMASGADGSVVVGRCRDDGAGGDPAVDGIWTCEPLSLAAGEARAALSVDGQRVPLGGVVVAAAGTSAQARVQAGRAVLDTAGGLLTPVEGAAPKPPRPVVLLRASGDWSAGAPMAAISGPEGAVQAGCRDDGTFPDRVRNDGELGCAAAAPGGPILVAMNTREGTPITLGTFAVDPDAKVVGLAWTRGEAAATLAPVDPWPWPAEGEVVTEPEPGPDPTPVGAPDVEPVDLDPQASGPDAQPPASDRQPDPTSHGPDPLGSPGGAAPQAHGGAADEHGRGLVDAMAVAGALGVGFSLAWFVAPRRERLPAGVERVQAPPLFEGGPGLSEPVVLFRTQAQRAFFAELLDRAAARRALLVVAPDGVSLPAVAGVAYRSHSLEWEVVAGQVRSLVGSHRTPLAVIVLGRDTLVSPGAVADDPVRLLAEALPTGSWLAVVGDPQAAPVGALVPWDATHDGEWTVSRAAAPPARA